VLARSISLRLGALLTALALGLTGAVLVDGASASDQSAVKQGKDPRKSRGLFVDTTMPAATEERVYRDRIGTYAQALWIIPEAYPTSQVRDVVRTYTKRALDARKTPMLTVYGIPGRDCGSHSSSGALQTATQYRAWIRQIALGVRNQTAMVVVEPDALPLFSSTVAPCPTTPEGWQGMLRYANKQLGRTDRWTTRREPALQVWPLL